MDLARELKILFIVKKVILILSGVLQKIPKNIDKKLREMAIL